MFNIQCTDGFKLRESLRLLMMIWPHTKSSRPLFFLAYVLGTREPPESLISRESTSGLGLQHSKAVEEVKCTFWGCSHLKLKHFLFILFEKQAPKLSILSLSKGGFSSLQPSGTETTIFNICDSPRSPNCDDTVHLGIKYCRNALFETKGGGGK